MIGPAAWLAWLAAVVYVHWHPFDFTLDPSRFAADSEEFPVYGLRRMTLAPFVDYYWGSKYNALDQFAHKGLLFLAAGVLAGLSVREIYRRGAFLAGTAAAVAVALQAGRYFLPAHGASATDVLIEAAGFCFGFRFTQYVRATLWADASLFGWGPPSPAPLFFINGLPDALRPSGQRQT